MLWWEARMQVPHEAADAVSAVLQSFPEVQGVAMEGGVTPDVLHPEYGEFLDDVLRTPSAAVTLTVYVPATHARAALETRIHAALLQVSDAGLEIGQAVASLTLTIVDEEEWASAWKEDYHPIPIAERFLVIPKWDADVTPEEAGRLRIVLEPGMAFGTGTHETTQMCLEALEDATVADRRVLDVGCGTAVLAIGAARLGATRVLAIDIDPVAVAVATDNVVDNGVATVVDVRVGDLLGDTPMDEPQFDIVIANILRDVVVALTPQVAPRVRPGGLFITSGYIAAHVPVVEAALQASGFTVQKIYQKRDWIALAAVKNA